MIKQYKRANTPIIIKYAQTQVQNFIISITVETSLNSSVFILSTCSLIHVYAAKETKTVCLA